MKVKTIKIKNFKSCPDMEVGLGKVNLLVGDNGRGKTSFQNAMRFLLNGALPDDAVRRGEDFLEVEGLLDDGQGTSISRTWYLPDTFQVNGADMKEKAFVAEVKKYREQYEAVGAAPSVGKRTNRFFIGKQPEVLWDFLQNGKVEGARIFGRKELELELGDGTVLYMAKSQQSKVAVDGKRTTAKALDEMLRSRMGGDPKALDIVTSSETLTAMKMTDFAKYLVSIVPVTIDYDKLEELAGLTEEESKILKPQFPPAPEPITLSDVSGVYKRLCEVRTVIGRQMDEWKDRSRFDGALPAMDARTAQEGAARVSEKIGAAKQLQREWDLYQKAVSNRENSIKTLSTWISEFNSMGRVESPEEGMLQKLMEQEQSLRNAVMADERTVSRMKQANIPLEKMLSGLGSSACPLCSDLVCKTDKTAAKQAISAAIESNRAAAMECEQRIKNGNKMLLQMQQAQNQVREKTVLHDRKARLYAQIKDLKATIPQIPKEPAKIPDIGPLRAELDKWNRYQKQAAVYEECKAAYDSYQKAEEQYQLYNRLIRKAEPKKGELTNTILKFLLEPFHEHINGFAKGIGNMEMSFQVEDDGLQVCCRPNGRDCFLKVSSLSTGERMLAVTAMMDMVSDISNSRIMVFDGLEALDAGNFKKLLDLLMSKDIQDRYDHIILSTVSHGSIMQLLDGYGEKVNIIRF